MVTQHYRWDFIGLSTDEKPTPANSEKVVDGSTFYCSDNSKLYVFYNDTWYERKALGGGGGGGGSYTAGTGIDITDDTISVDTTTIQEKLTAGTNVTISDNTISATDTTYSNFTGTDGTAAGLAGLVPAPTTSDTDKYLKSDGTWSTVSGGGSSVTVVQTGGDSTTDVMSQNATTSLIFADPTTMMKIKIGAGTYSSEGEDGIEIGHNAKASGVQAVAIGVHTVSSGNRSLSIGYGSTATKTDSIAIGTNVGDKAEATANTAIAIGTGAKASAVASIALGCLSTASQQGEMNIGVSTTIGYNSSNYRLLTGLYDPQSAHDAATKGYVDPSTDSTAPTSATVGRLGEIFIDTINADAYMCVAVDTVTPSYTWKQITV